MVADWRMTKWWTIRVGGVLSLLQRWMMMVRNLPLLLLFIYAAAPCSGVNSNGCSSLERYKDCQEIRYTTAQHHVILMRIGKQEGEYIWTTGMKKWRAWHVIGMSAECHSKLYLKATDFHDIHDSTNIHRQYNGLAVIQSGVLCSWNLSLEDKRFFWRFARESAIVSILNNILAWQLNLSVSEVNLG